MCHQTDFLWTIVSLELEEEERRRKWKWARTSDNVGDVKELENVFLSTAGYREIGTPEEGRAEKWEFRKGS